MKTSNSREFGGVNASSEAEMRAFDALPRELRDLLNYSQSECYSAVQLARARSANSAPSAPKAGAGGFTIHRPQAGPTREELAEAIRKAEAAMPPPLKEPKCSPTERRSTRHWRGGAKLKRRLLA